MKLKHPHLMIVAGPNGSGKTTIARELSKAQGLRYLGADDIAEELAPGEWERARVQAGRLFIERARSGIKQRDMLLLESTLSGRTLSGLVNHAREAGFGVSIIFVFLESVKHCLARVQERVRKGGHNVPEADIERRFVRSLSNFWSRYRQQADQWYLIFNSGDVPLDVAMGEGDEIEVLDEILFEKFLELKGEKSDE